MNRDEAIDFLECRRAYYASLSTDPNPNVKATKVCGYTLAESANACLMAIKALEQEPCEDAISRKAVLECFTWTNDKAAEIPDNATNGDMIKALFPHGKQETREPIMRFAIDNYTYEFSYKWWNAPYKSESDKSADTFEKLLNSGFYERFRKE